MEVVFLELSRLQSLVGCAVRGADDAPGTCS
jgi:hypothetical protein